MSKYVSKKKGGFAKSLIGNPFIQEDHFVYPEIETRLVEHLPRLLEGIYPRRVSGKEAAQSLPNGIWDLPKEERKRLLKERKKTLGVQEVPKAHLKNCFSIGMQKCLREIQRGKLALLMLDGNTDFQIIETLWCQTMCPIINVSDMSNLVSNSLGFKASMIGLYNTNKEESNDTLQTMRILQQELEAAWKVRKNSRSKDETEKTSPTPLHAAKEVSFLQTKEELPTPNCDTESLLLQRKDKSTRVFRPRQQEAALKEEDFGKDFLSFSKPAAAAETVSSTNKKRKEKSSAYRKSKMIKLNK